MFLLKMKNEPFIFYLKTEVTFWSNKRMLVLNPFGYQVPILGLDPVTGECNDIYHWHFSAEK